MGTLSELMKISPGFKATVNIIEDSDNERKVAGYLPTAFGRDILGSVAASLDVVSTDRAHIIHGNFGTGKSHLALLLAQFLSRAWGNSVLAPVLDKIRMRDSDLYSRLELARSAVPSPFLVVPLVGYRGSIAEGLLTALDQSLQSANLGSLMPETMFHAAIKRLEQVETEYSAHKAALEQAVLAENLVSVATLKQNLRKYRPEALEAFRRIHPQFSAGAPFPHHHEQKPNAVYRAVAKKLVESEKYGGIFVVWDEFGENLRQMVTEHHRREYLDLQNFAESCAASRDFQVHFLGLTHQSLGEFMATAGSLGRDTLNDLNKMAGRFTQWAVRAQDGEIYRLMDEILIPVNQARVTSFFKTYRNWLERWTEQASSLRLFPTLSSREVLEVVGEGCYPLHPAAAFCLPELSEKVAQNERTLFYFLSATGPGTLSDYLRKTPLPDAKDMLPVFTVDALWDYFAPLIQSDSRRIGAGRVWSQYDQTPKTQDAMSNRVLRVIALLQVINHEKLRPTADTIMFCLGAVGSQKDETLAVLSKLSTGPAKSLTHSRNNAEYSFAAGSAMIDLEEEIRQAVEARTGLLAPANYIQKMNDTDLTIPIEPTDHNDKYAINRKFAVRMVTVKELEESELKDKGPASAPADGLALFALAGDHAEVHRARKAALNFTNPRVLIAVPKEPVNYELAVRRLDALEHIRKEKGEIFDEGKPQSGDWEYCWVEEVGGLRSELERKFTPSDEGPDWFWKGIEHSSITGGPRLKRLAATAMDEAFSKTLRISHDRLMDDSWERDQQAKYRKAVVNYLFRPGSGPREAALVENNAEKKVITAVWKGPGYLRNENGLWVVGRPSSKNTGAEVWDLVESYLKSAQDQERDFQALIAQLRNPPFGMRNRVLPVILAAVMQPYLSNLVVSRGGSRVTLDGETLEGIAQAPRQYRVKYVELSDREDMMLRAFEEAFGVAQADEVSSRVASVKKAVLTWTNGLSRYARHTSSVDTPTRAMLDNVFLPLGNAQDPWAVITKDLPMQADIPHLATATSEQLSDAARIIMQSKATLDKALERLETQVLGIISKAFGQSGDTATSSIHAATTWYTGLSAAVRTHAFGGDFAKLVEWAKSLSPQVSKNEVLAIAERLIGEPLSQWTDSFAAKFEGKMESVVGHLSSFVPPQDTSTSTGESTSREVRGQYGDLQTEPETGTGNIGTVGDDGNGVKRNSGSAESHSPEPRRGLGTGGGGTEGRTSDSSPDYEGTHTAGAQPERETRYREGVGGAGNNPPKVTVHIEINGKPVQPLSVDLDAVSRDLLDNLREVLAVKAQTMEKDRLAAIILRLLEEKVSS